MPFVESPGSVTTEFRYTWRALPVETTLSFHKPGNVAFSQQDVADLHDWLLAWHQANIQTQQSTDISLVELFTTTLDSAISPAYSYTSNLPQGGDDPAVSVASNQALCVTFKTAGRGRSSRGRNYVPGLRASVLVGNYWTPITGSNLQAAYNALLAIETDLSMQWVVLSKETGGVERAQALVQPVTGAVVRSLLVASQEPRKR